MISNQAAEMPPATQTFNIPIEAQNFGSGRNSRSSWLLRWDTKSQFQPEVTLPEETLSDFAAHLHTYPTGFVLFEGYLFDQTDYLSDPEATPAACVAKAYREGGEAFFDRLRGGYALAMWDDQRKRLLAGRDAMGLHPCYYYWNGRRLVLSPDLDLILAQPEVEGEFNRVILAEFLNNRWNDHQRHETFYEEINRLPPAHELYLKEGLLEIRRYWDPVPLGFEWASEDEQQDLYPLLERAVARCLQIGADSLSLSGGFDSVSLAVLAADQLEGREPLYALSLRFDIAGSDEWETQSAVAHRLSMPQMMRSLSEFMPEKRVVADTLDLLSNCPLPVSGLLQSIYRGLYDPASQSGLKKLIMGTGGDEMFVVDVGYAADCLAALDLKNLWRYYRTLAPASPGSSFRVARNIFWTYTTKLMLIELLRASLETISPRLAKLVRARHLALPDWLVPSDADLAYTLLNRRLHPPEVEVAPGEGRYVRAIRGLVQSSHFVSHLEQSYTWTGRSGFTLLYPYFDRDLVDLTLRMPPHRLISGGLDKAPLRRLVAERLPMVNLASRKVSFTPTYDVILKEHGGPVWRELGRPVNLADLGLVDPDRLSLLIDDYFSGLNQQILLTWHVLSAESWLRSRAK